MLMVLVPGAPPPPTDPPGSVVNRRIDSLDPEPLPRLVAVMNSVALVGRLRPPNVRVWVWVEALAARMVRRPPPLSVRVPSVSAALAEALPYNWKGELPETVRAGAVVVFSRVATPAVLSSRRVAPQPRLIAV